MRHIVLTALIGTALLASAGGALGQRFERTAVSFTATDEDAAHRYRLRFSRYPDTAVYRGMQFDFRPLAYLGPSLELPRLADCVPVIGRLWDAAAESIAIDLRWADVGYPSQFADVLRKQAEVFASSPDWKRQLQRKQPSHDFRRLGPIMLEGRVYGCLDSLLAARGYAIVHIGTEKHGFLRPENLRRLYPKPALKGMKLRDIPLPFIVTIGVAPSGPLP